jgi:hypothetical protein
MYLLYSNDTVSGCLTGTVLTTLDLVGNANQIAISLDQSNVGVQLNQIDRTLITTSRLAVSSDTGADQISFMLTLHCTVIGNGTTVSCSLHVCVVKRNRAPQYM